MRNEREANMALADSLLHHRPSPDRTGLKRNYYRGTLPWWRRLFNWL